MKTHIYIVTYAKDAPWLTHCLRSIVKFAAGFSGTTVLAPRRDEAAFTVLCAQNGADLKLFDEAPPPLGHLHHNVMKCSADMVCPFDDFFCHIDSDCIFREPVTPEDYFVGGKPVLLMESYARLGGAVPWKPIVDNALHVDAQYEFMRRHPAVHYRELYAQTRDWVYDVQGVPFTEWVLRQRPVFPCGFAEFDTLGEVAWQRFNDRYHFIDVGRHPYPRSKLIQFWSHGPMDQEQKIWIDGQLIPVVPLNLINKIVGP